MRVLAVQLWAAVRPVNSQQRFLAWCGSLLLVSGLAHAVVAAVDGSAWWGAVSWRKPTVFGLSFGVFVWSAAWVMRQLPVRRRLGWLVAGIIGGASVIEVALITMQRWRGKASHFNAETPLDDAVWGVMGNTVIILTLGVFVLFVWTLLKFRGEPAAKVAAVVGLTGVLVAGAIGGKMAAVGESVVDETGHVPSGVVFGAAGSAKLAHGVGLHGFQVLMLFCIGLALGPLRPSVQRRLMLLAAAGFAALFGSVAVTALNGVAWTRPSAAAALVALAGLAALATVALFAGRSLAWARHRPGTRPGTRPGVRPGTRLGS